MQLNIADLFEALADAAPDRPALVGGGARLTYRQLDDRANRVAHHLLGTGVAAGSFVGVLAHNRTEWLEVMLGCFKSRTVPVNLNFRYVAPELRYVVEDAGLAALVFERSFGALVEESTSGLAVHDHCLMLADGATVDRPPDGWLDYEEALAAASSTRNGMPVRSGDDLYVVYTGGTTGMPKGVLWRQEDLYLGPLGGSLRKGGPVTGPAEVVERLPAEAGRPIMLVVPPLMHGTGQWTSLGPLLSGATVVLFTEPRFTPEAVLETVARERITALVMVGDVMGRPLAQALHHDPAAYDTSSLSVIITSGAPLSDAVRDELTALIPHLRIINRLGSSESGTMGVASGTTPGGLPRSRFSVSSDTAVLGEDLRPVTPGDGQIGRVARRGHIPLGYHNDPVKTAATFVTDPDGTRWVLPGDYANVLEDGSIIMLGRGSTTINSGGEKIYPQEVEAALTTHPDVFSAIVVGVPDQRYGEQVAAVVQPRRGTTPTLEELVTHCRDRVAGYKVPRRLLLVDDIPLTPVGKPDHRAARDLLTR